MFDTVSYTSRPIQHRIVRLLLRSVQRTRITRNRYFFHEHPQDQRLRLSFFSSLLYAAAAVRTRVRVFDLGSTYRLLILVQYLGKYGISKPKASRKAWRSSLNYLSTTYLCTAGRAISPPALKSSPRDSYEKRCRPVHFSCETNL